MDQTAPATVAVVLKERPASLAPVAQAWAAVFGIPVFDASKKVRDAGGILLENAPREVADKLAAGLGKAGVVSVVAPMDRLARLVPAVDCKLRREGDGLKAQVPGGADVMLPLARIRILAVFALKETTRDVKKVTEGPTLASKALRMGISLSTGIPLPKQKTKVVEKVTENEAFVFFLDVVTTDGKRFRATADALDYGFLGDRKLHQALGNFKLLIADLAVACPNALRNLGAEIMLASRPVSQMGYSSPADVDRELRWMLTVAPRVG